MSSSEFHTEHVQPTIEYGGPADNTNSAGEIPEVVIVAEAEDDSGHVDAEDWDTSTILAAEDRGDYDDATDQSTIKQQPTEAVEDEEAVDEPVTEQIPHIRDETEVIANDQSEQGEVPVLVAREAPTPRRVGQSVGEAIVEAVLDYLEGDGEDDVVRTAVVKPVPAAAAEVPVETVNEVTPEVEETAVVELPATEDDQVAAAEALNDATAELDTPAESDMPAPEETLFVDPGLGEVAVTGSLPGEAKGDGTPDTKATDIRDLVEQGGDGDTAETVVEAADETEAVAIPQSPLGFVLAQLPANVETAVPQPVMTTSEAATAAADDVINESEVTDDLAREAESGQVPAHSVSQAEIVEPRSASEGDDGEEVLGPVVLQNSQVPPKLGPEFPSFKSDQSRLSRILDGIGTGAALAGALTTAGLSAGSLPVRLAMTKIDDRQVKHEGLFTYKITVQGGGKSQTITVNSPFGRTFAKFQARVRFARDKLAP